MAKDTKEKPIGVVVHYFGNIGVAVVKLSGDLKVGDDIKICGGETEFTQNVDSMEHDHKKMNKVSKGKEVGMKVKEKVREGYKVYKI